MIVKGLVRNLPDLIEDTNRRPTTATATVLVGKTHSRREKWIRFARVMIADACLAGCAHAASYLSGRYDEISVAPGWQRVAAWKNAPTLQRYVTTKAVQFQNGSL